MILSYPSIFVNIQEKYSWDLREAAFSEKKPLPHPPEKATWAGIACPSAWGHGASTVAPRRGESSKKDQRDCSVHAGLSCSMRPNDRRSRGSTQDTDIAPKPRHCVAARPLKGAMPLRDPCGYRVPNDTLIRFFGWAREGLFDSKSRLPHPHVRFFMAPISASWARMQAMA